VTWALLAGLLLVQPWLRWPSLWPDTSHRLTLVCLLVAFGLHRVVSGQARERFPAAWAWWVAAVLGVLVAQSWHVIASGDYFRYFQETALFSDGLIALLSGVWGLWALVQLPAQTFRACRWVGLAFLVVNVLVMGGQAWAHRQMVGAFGLERLAGAYGVAWLPVCLAWHPAAAVAPALMIALCHKPLPMIAALMACWPLCPRRWKSVLMTAVVVSTWLWLGTTSLVALKVAQRTDTWWHAWCASLVHPWVGWGLTPFALNTIRQTYGYLLPSLHSDWLALAVHLGWVVAGGAVWLWSRTVRMAPCTRWATAVQGSLLGLGMLSAVQSTVSHARMAGLLLFFLAWFAVEQREESEHGTT